VYAEAFQAAFKFADREARRVAFERLRGLAHWSGLRPLLPNERLPAVVIEKSSYHLTPGAARPQAGSEEAPLAAGQATLGCLATASRGQPGQPSWSSAGVFFWSGYAPAVSISEAIALSHCFCNT
jgi:hypothetical protein